MKKILLLLTVLFSISFAQQLNGVITGTIKEEMTNTPLVGVAVIIEGTQTGTTTNSEGKYEIRNLPVGKYSVKASIIGYTPLIKTDVFINNIKPLILDFSLSQSTIELKGITVKGGYFQKDPQSINSVSVFSYEEIRRSPGSFEDVVRALSVLPGVAQASAGRNDLVVRGGAPSENLYIIDEFIVPNINHFGTQGASGGSLSYIDLNYVQETSFSSGGFSAMYGDKLSSVLKINLKEGRKDRVGAKVLISATQFGVNAEGPISDNQSFILSVRRSYLDLIFKAAGFGFIPEYYDVLSKYNYKPDNKNSFSFLLISAFDKVKYNNSDEDKRYDNSRILGSNQTNYMTGINYKHLYEKGFFNINISRSYNDFDTRQNDSLLNPLFLDKSKEGENNIKTDFVYKTSEMSELNFGAEGKYTKFSADVFFPPYITALGDTLRVNYLSSKDNYYKFGIFGQYTDVIFKIIKLNVGLRTDYFNAIKNKFSFSPRLSFSYILDELTNINFSTGIYHQSPSYIWLLADPLNKNLNFIQSNHFILGVERLLQEDLLFRVEGFIKKYSDYPASTLRPYLVLANTGGGYSGSEDNFSSFGLEHLVSEGFGDVKGIELLIQKKSSDTPLYGTFSLTYSKAYFEGLDKIKRVGAYDQNWIVNLSGGYIFDENWQAGLKFRYSTGSPYTPFNEHGTQIPSAYNSGRLTPNHSLDIRVDRRFYFTAWSLVTYIDIQNIYNRKNLDSYRWDVREKKIVENRSIGILPSIGIIAEF